MKSNLLTDLLLAPPPRLTWPGRLDVYEFEMWPIGREFPMVGGLYVFCHRIGQNWYADYIGRTRHFGIRIGRDLRQHHCWPKIVAAGSTHVGTLVVTDVFDRARFEADLIASVQPPCNSR